MSDAKPTGLDLMRQPFPAHQISKLPKPTKKQTDDVRADFKLGVRCKMCGQWHHKDVVHLDYVGHAALTDRLLDCDAYWNWEPAAINESGGPLMDSNGGMWIRLTVCDVSRLGYGSADGKSGGDAVKEVIGDALRNAAMRFGAALDLWHKGDLHVTDDEPTKKPPQDKQASKPPATDESERDRLLAAINKQTDASTLRKLYDQPNFEAAMNALPVPMQNELATAHTSRMGELS